MIDLNLLFVRVVSLMEMMRKLTLTIATEMTIGTGEIEFFDRQVFLYSM